MSRHFSTRFGLVLVCVALLLSMFVVNTTPTQALAPAWEPNTAYSVNERVSYDGVEYACIQSHTSLVGWEPPNVPALWSLQSDTPPPTPIQTVTAEPTQGATATPGPTSTPVATPTPRPNPGGDLPDRLLVGYWHNFDNSSRVIRLRDVSPAFDVINVSFAEPTTPSGSTMAFTPFNASVDEFKSDIAYLQDQGKKVLISIGGANGAVDLSGSGAQQNFATSMTNIISEYGFDGMDIDLEGSSVSLVPGDTDFKNPISPKVVNLVAASRTISNQFGADFILTMAPETAYVQGGLNNYGNIWGAYLPVIYGLLDKLTYIHVQHYNSGTMTGLDGKNYAQSTADFHVAMGEMLLAGFPVGNNPSNVFPALSPEQVLIGLPSEPRAAGGGYTSPTEVQRALDYLIKGNSFGGSYQLQNPSGYPSMRGLMTWSINWDAASGFEFSGNHRPYLDSLN
ncbi:MAG: chitinase [Chloroflexi bacterium AL-W]|nr:chitinase [Chloroflexi bacterium AL-N1]NOK67405.1 chitinase [Chloroflexi bacterium AL-N10]NOK75103.1 chitinase [Chloroflexi bacterium AL-N5]NOK81890.1 chitinase [Chloroflexi bacterium AL-W]NOK89736.1 chitinase [Chloroflexi bacterium AL-N15]